jgi:hypothetical protein
MRTSKIGNKHSISAKTLLRTSERKKLTRKQTQPQSRRKRPECSRNLTWTLKFKSNKMLNLKIFLMMIYRDQIFQCPNLSGRQKWQRPRKLRKTKNKRPKLQKKKKIRTYKI